LRRERLGWLCVSLPLFEFISTISTSTDQTLPGLAIFITEIAGLPQEAVNLTKILLGSIASCAPGVFSAAFPCPMHPIYFGGHTSDSEVWQNMPAVLTTTEERDSTATFTVALGWQPLDSVTLFASSADVSEGRVAPSLMTFAPSNWDTYRKVTVTGLDDAVADEDIIYNITIVANSLDTHFNDAVSDVMVQNANADILDFAWEYLGNLSPNGSDWTPRSDSHLACSTGHNADVADSGIWQAGPMRPKPNTTAPPGRTAWAITNRATVVCGGRWAELLCLRYCSRAECARDFAWSLHEGPLRWVTVCLW
jgi:hypothetical protein